MRQAGRFRPSATCQTTAGSERKIVTDNRQVGICRMNRTGHPPESTRRFMALISLHRREFENHDLGVASPDILDGHGGPRFPENIARTVDVRLAGVLHL
jgi:hypothetical protein